MVRLGLVAIGAGIFIQALGSSFMPFFVGQAILMIGFAFVSGADDALFFEKLNFKRDSPHWRKLVTRGSQFALGATLVATLAGSWLHTINPRAPWILTALAFLVAAWLIWPIRDSQSKRVSGKIAAEIKDYFHNIKTGFMQFHLPKLWLYVPIIMTVQGLFYVTGFGMLRIVLLDRFTFDPFWGAVAVAVCSLITVGLLSFMHKHAENLSEKRMLLLVSLSAAAGLVLSVADIGLWGFVVILALYVGEHVLHPFMSEVLNNHAPNEQRATVLSVASFLRALPYVVLAPVIGYLNTSGELHYFLIIWAVLICGAVALYVLAKRRDTRIKIEESP